MVALHTHTRLNPNYDAMKESYFFLHPKLFGFYSILECPKIKFLFEKSMKKFPTIFSTLFRGQYHSLTKIYIKDGNNLYHFI